MNKGKKEHVTDLAEKVKELNKRLVDIQREQQYQREREAEFRSLSDSTNSKAVWWSIIQICVLFGTCIWQSRHLRVGDSRFYNPRCLHVGFHLQKFFDKV